MKRNYKFDAGVYETQGGQIAKVFLRDPKLFGIVQQEWGGWREASWDLEGRSGNPNRDLIPPKSVFWVCQKVSEPTAIVVFNGEDAADEFAQTMQELNAGDYRTIKVEEVGS
jgi:hypothetical protein